MTEQNTTPDAPSFSALQYDPELFREYVRDMNLSAEQQDALLEAVWLVIVGIIDLGLGLHIRTSIDSKPLVADSSSVLAFFSNSSISNAKDAQAEQPSARRIDS